MSKPFAGYPSRSAAIRAFVKQGLSRKEIAYRLGVSATTASTMIAQSRRGEPVRAQRELAREGGKTAALEAEIMDRWDAGQSLAAIIGALSGRGVSERTIRSIVYYMREGEAERANSAAALASCSNALASAVERVQPIIAPKPRPALSFEEQLARVASGRARVVTKFEPCPVPEQTLGGVGSSML